MTFSRTMTLAAATAMAVAFSGAAAFADHHAKMVGGAAMYEKQDDCRKCREFSRP